MTGIRSYYISNFTRCQDKNTQQNQLQDGRAYFSSQFETPGRHSRAKIVAGALGSWSHCVHSQDRERKECYCSLHASFCPVQDPASRKNTTHIWEFILPTSINQIKKLPQRQAGSLVSRVLDFIKLTKVILSMVIFAPKSLATSNGFFEFKF